LEAEGPEHVKDIHIHAHKEDLVELFEAIYLANLPEATKPLLRAAHAMWLRLDTIPEELGTSADEGRASTSLLQREVRTLFAKPNRAHAIKTTFEDGDARSTLLSIPLQVFNGEEKGFYFRQDCGCVVVHFDSHAIFVATKDPVHDSYSFLDGVLECISEDVTLKHEFGEVHSVRTNFAPGQMDRETQFSLMPTLFLPTEVLLDMKRTSNSRNRPVYAALVFLRDTQVLMAKRVLVEAGIATLHGNYDFQMTPLNVLTLPHCTPTSHPKEFEVGANGNPTRISLEYLICVQTSASPTQVAIISDVGTRRSAIEVPETTYRPIRNNPFNTNITFTGEDDTMGAIKTHSGANFRCWCEPQPSWFPVGATQATAPSEHDPSLGIYDHAKTASYPTILVPTNYNKMRRTGTVVTLETDPALQDEARAQTAMNIPTEGIMPKDIKVLLKSERARVTNRLPVQCKEDSAAYSLLQRLSFHTSLFQEVDVIHPRDPVATRRLVSSDGLVDIVDGTPGQWAIFRSVRAFGAPARQDPDLIQTLPKLSAAFLDLTSASKADKMRTLSAYLGHPIDTVPGSAPLRALAQLLRTAIGVPPTCELVERKFRVDMPMQVANPGLAIHSAWPAYAASVTLLHRLGLNLAGFPDAAHVFEESTKCLTQDHAMHYAHMQHRIHVDAIVCATPDAVGFCCRDKPTRDLVSTITSSSDWGMVLTTLLHADPSCAVSALMAVGCVPPWSLAHLDPSMFPVGLTLTPTVFDVFVAPTTHDPKPMENLHGFMAGTVPLSSVVTPKRTPLLADAMLFYTVKTSLNGANPKSIATTRNSLLNHMAAFALRLATFTVANVGLDPDTGNMCLTHASKGLLLQEGGVEEEDASTVETCCKYARAFNAHLALLRVLGNNDDTVSMTDLDDVGAFLDAGMPLVNTPDTHPTLVDTHLWPLRIKFVPWTRRHAGARAAVPWCKAVQEASVRSARVPAKLGRSTTWRLPPVPQTPQWQPIHPYPLLSHTEAQAVLREFAPQGVDPPALFWSPALEDVPERLQTLYATGLRAVFDTFMDFTLTSECHPQTPHKRTNLMWAAGCNLQVSGVFGGDAIAAAAAAATADSDETYLEVLLKMARLHVVSTACDQFIRGVTSDLHATWRYLNNRLKTFKDVGGDARVPGPSVHVPVQMGKPRSFFSAWVKPSLLLAGAFPPTHTMLVVDPPKGMEATGGGGGGSGSGSGSFGGFGGFGGGTSNTQMETLLHTLHRAPVLNSPEARTAWTTPWRAPPTASAQTMSWTRAWPTVATTPTDAISWGTEVATLALSSPLSFSAKSKSPAMATRTRVFDPRGHWADVVMGLGGDWFFVCLNGGTDNTTVFGRRTGGVGAAFGTPLTPTFQLFTGNTIGDKPTRAFDRVLGTLAPHSSTPAAAGAASGSSGETSPLPLFCQTSGSSISATFTAETGATPLAGAISTLLTHPDFWWLLLQATSTKFLRSKGSPDDVSTLENTMFAGGYHIRAENMTTPTTCNKLHCELRSTSTRHDWEALDKLCSPRKALPSEDPTHRLSRDIAQSALAAVPAFGPCHSSLSPLRAVRTNVGISTQLHKALQAIPFPKLLALANALEALENTETEPNDTRVNQDEINRILSICGVPMWINNHGRQVTFANGTTEPPRGEVVIRQYLKHATLPLYWGQPFTATSTLLYDSTRTGLPDLTHCMYVPMMANFVQQTSSPPHGRGSASLVPEKLTSLKAGGARFRRNCNVAFAKSQFGYEHMKKSLDSKQLASTNPLHGIVKSSDDKSLRSTLHVYTSPIPGQRKDTVLLSRTAIIVCKKKVFNFVQVPQASTGDILTKDHLNTVEILRQRFNVPVTPEDKLLEIRNTKRLLVPTAIIANHEEFSTRMQKTVNTGLSCALAMTSNLGLGLQIPSGELVDYDPMFISYSTPRTMAFPDEEGKDCRPFYEYTMWPGGAPVHVSDCFGVVRPTVHFCWAQTMRGVFNGLKHMTANPREDITPLMLWQKTLDAFGCDSSQAQAPVGAPASASASANPAKLKVPQAHTDLASAYAYTLSVFKPARANLIFAMLGKALDFAASSGSTGSATSTEPNPKFQGTVDALKAHFSDFDVMCTSRMEDADMTKRQTASTQVKAKVSVGVSKTDMLNNFDKGCEQQWTKDWERMQTQYPHLSLPPNPKTLTSEHKAALIGAMQVQAEQDTGMTMGQAWSFLQLRPTALEKFLDESMFTKELRALTGLMPEHMTTDWQNNMRSVSEARYKAVRESFFQESEKRHVVTDRLTKLAKDSVESMLQAGMLCLTHWVADASRETTKCKGVIPPLVAIVEAVVTLGRFATFCNKSKQKIAWVDPLAGKDFLATKVAKRLAKALCSVLVSGTALAFDPFFMLAHAPRIAKHLYIDTSKFHIQCRHVTTREGGSTSEDNKDRTVAVFKAPAPTSGSTSFVRYLDNGGWLGYSLFPITHITSPLQNIRAGAGAGAGGGAGGDTQESRPRLKLAWHGARPIQLTTSIFAKSDGTSTGWTEECSEEALVPNMTDLVHKDDPDCECNDPTTLKYSMAACLAFQTCFPSIPFTMGPKQKVSRVIDGVPKIVEEDVATTFAPLALHAQINASANALSRVVATAVMRLTPDA